MAIPAGTFAADSKRQSETKLRSEVGKAALKGIVPVVVSGLRRKDRRYQMAGAYLFALYRDSYDDEAMSFLDFYTPILEGSQEQVEQAVYDLLMDKLSKMPGHLNEYSRCTQLTANLGLGLRIYLDGPEVPRHEIVENTCDELAPRFQMSAESGAWVFKPIDSHFFEEQVEQRSILSDLAEQSSDKPSFIQKIGQWFSENAGIFAQLVQLVWTIQEKSSAIEQQLIQQDLRRPLDVHDRNKYKNDIMFALFNRYISEIKDSRARADLVERWRKASTKEEQSETWGSLKDKVACFAPQETWDDLLFYEYLADSGLSAKQKAKFETNWQNAIDKQNVWEKLWQVVFNMNQERSSLVSWASTAKHVLKHLEHRAAGNLSHPKMQAVKKRYEEMLRVMHMGFDNLLQRTSRFSSGIELVLKVRKQMLEAVKDAALVDERDSDGLKKLMAHVEKLKQEYQSQENIVKQRQEALRNWQELVLSPNPSTMPLGDIEARIGFLRGNLTDEVRNLEQREKAYREKESDLERTLDGRSKQLLERLEDLFAMHQSAIRTTGGSEPQHSEDSGRRALMFPTPTRVGPSTQATSSAGASCVSAAGAAALGAPVARASGVPLP